MKIFIPKNNKNTTANNNNEISNFLENNNNNNKVFNTEEDLIESSMENINNFKVVSQLVNHVQELDNLGRKNLYNVVYGGKKN